MSSTERFKSLATTSMKVKGRLPLVEHEILLNEDLFSKPRKLGPRRSLSPFVMSSSLSCPCFLVAKIPTMIYRNHSNIREI